MSKINLFYLNAKVVDFHKTQRTETLTLILNTNLNPLLCLELRLPDPRAEWPMPDALQEVVGYRKGQFLRVAVTDPEGPVVGIGHFQDHKWFDIAKYKGTGPGIDFPKEAPADWDGNNAGWINMRISGSKMRVEDYGTRIDISLYGPGEELKLDARYAGDNMQRFAADFRTICCIADVTTWSPDGRFVRVRRDNRARKIAIGHLFDDLWFERFA
jgi:hypothetical protein